ncbi:MAG: Rieske (2Fe-2S) protein, partial [Sandaracinaceae bacterium]|nr:Rieske (2Fe-2S) protein [Sandaracinaceae bacterium]
MPRFLLFGRGLPEASPRSARPDWQQADPAKIERALGRALAQPSGGWAVLDASRRITRSPRAFRVAGHELVAWRSDQGVHAAPDACPHMGASLACGHVDARGRIVCPWHGLAMSRKHGSWRELVAHDDGVLAWVRLPALLAPGEAPADTPILPERPVRFVEGTIRMEARCEPRDVLANRLDPWHGAHFHPHSFLRLSVIDEDDRQITVRVVYKVLGPLAMEVDARFDCPDPRTVVMTIVAGDGAGSVVETHATPIDDAHTAIVEATLATSDRGPFSSVAKLQTLLRPLIEGRARRLWVEDRAYAERTYAL